MLRQLCLLLLRDFHQESEISLNIFVTRHAVCLLWALEPVFKSFQRSHQQQYLAIFPDRRLGFCLVSGHPFKTRIPRYNRAKAGPALNRVKAMFD